MTPSIEIKTHQVFIAGLFLTFCAICLSVSLFMVGHNLRQGMEKRAHADLQAAKLYERAATHKAMEALYTSVKWEQVVAVKNDKIEELDGKLQRVCRKNKSKLCL